MFEEVIRKHPLPESLAYVFAGDSAGEAMLGLVVEREGGRESKDRGDSQKTTPGIFSASVKKAWEESPNNARTIPLNEIRLPDIACASALADGSLSVQSDEKAILSIDKSAPEPLLAWFEQAAPELENPVIWIAAVGDIMLERGIQEILLSGEGGTTSVFSDTLSLLEGADFLLGNLEGAVTDAGIPFPKTYRFRFKPDSPAALAEAGFDYLMLANNHTYDYGPNGFSDTLANLHRAGLAYSGAGKDLSEAGRPFSTQIRGTALNVISFGAYPSEVPIGLLKAGQAKAGVLWEKEGLAVVKNMASEESFDIVMVHAGTEYSDNPDAAMRKLYHSVIDAGADCVLGSHPHVLQGIEVYKAGLIVYSLGNFIFPGMGAKPNALDSMILFLGIHDGRIVAVVPVFVRLTDTGVHISGSGAKRFYRLSALLAGK